MTASLQSALHRLHFKTENDGICYTCSQRKKLLQVAGSYVAEHLSLLNRELETRSVLKIRKHHQHSEKGGVSLIARMGVRGQRGAAHPHIHNKYTGSIISLHFLEVSPLMCAPGSLFPSLLVVCVIFKMALADFYCHHHSFVQG